MTKKLITDYNYREERKDSYQIIREYTGGEIVVLNNSIGEVLEIQGTQQALNYVAVMNENARDCTYKMRKV